MCTYLSRSRSKRPRSVVLCLDMGLLDGIPLYLAKGAAVESPPSAPLTCIFFSAQWCPGEGRLRQRLFALVVKSYCK